MKKAIETDFKTPGIKSYQQRCQTNIMANRIGLWKYRTMNKNIVPLLDGIGVQGLQELAKWGTS